MDYKEFGRGLISNIPAFCGGTNKNDETRQLR
jgi:hypothetical protein